MVEFDPGPPKSIANHLAALPSYRAAPQPVLVRLGPRSSTAAG